MKKFVLTGSTLQNYTLQVLVCSNKNRKVETAFVLLPKVGLLKF